KLLDQRTESARLNRAMGKAGVSTKRLAADNAALETQLNRTRAAQQKLNAVIMKQKANGRARDSKRAQLFDAVAMAGTAAFPMVFAGRFEQSMAEVKAISGATAKDFASMNQRARQLGASTSFSASEVAGGMKYLAMAGFEANEVVAAMPGLLSMARAGATDLAMSSDIASDILSGFGLKAGEMNKVADVLTKTFTTSNTTLEGLGETMKYVAPVATKAGLGIEDMATMAGLLGNVGIKGSESGTALRAMILRLAAPTGEAATALANMGVEARDAEGNIRPMIDLLSEIAQESENMGSGEQLEMLKRIFGERPAASVAELIDKAGTQGITEYLKQIQASQGTAKKTAAIMDKTLFGSVKRLASAGEGLAISFGGQLIPTFTNVVDGAAWVTSGMIGLTERFPTLTKWVGLTGTGIAALG
ncbi:MAG: phage tail tape measure protein, partial [Desulfovibrionales bacterium]|nr:phage tail tape measure protein [Desulfovibrionales bacterium]